MAMAMQSGKRRLRSEFPDFGELDVELPEGFSDTSWHNDVMPSFTRDLAGGCSVILWIDYADEDKRECGGCLRFASVLRDKDDVTIDEFASDNWQEVFDWTAALIANLG